MLTTRCVFPDPVIHCDVAPITDCLEMFKMSNENEVHIRVGCLDQNAGESAVQSMDYVKDDPCVGLLLVAHCCYIVCRTDMTNSRSVAHSDVDISSLVEPLHHFPREIPEEFDLVGAIAKKFEPVTWNPHVWAYFQANTVATLVTCVPLEDIGRYVSQTMSSRDSFRSST